MSGDHHEVAAFVQHAAAELGGELLGDEHALEDLPARAVVQHAFIPALGLFIGLTATADDHELGREAARLGDEARAVVLFEVAVEVAREEPIERAVLERQVERVALDERRAGHLLPSHIEHGAALIEAGHVAAQTARHEPGAAGNVECSLRRQAGDPSFERRALLVPAGPVFGGIEIATEPPVVVLARARVVVGLHRP